MAHPDVKAPLPHESGRTADELGDRNYLGDVATPAPAMKNLDHFMQFRRTALPGCFVIEPALIEDERGMFARTFCADEFTRQGLTSAIAQCSISFNHAKGTLRGLHYQAPPHQEAKLVRCTRGRIFDAAVDVRPGSPTFARWAAVELTAANHLALYIPEGVAHGFVTLEPESEVSYQISVTYQPEASAGVRWDDPEIAIDWPDVGPLTMSARDRNLPTLSGLMSRS